MAVIGKGVHIGQDFPQSTLPAVGFGVLLTGEPTEEIGRAVVEFVGDEMVAEILCTLVIALLGGGHSSRLSGGRSGARTIESKRHEDVAAFIVKVPHYRILTTCKPSG